MFQAIPEYLQQKVADRLIQNMSSKTREMRMRRQDGPTPWDDYRHCQGLIHSLYPSLYGMLLAAIERDKDKRPDKHADYSSAGVQFWSQGHNYWDL